MTILPYVLKFWPVLILLFVAWCIVIFLSTKWAWFRREITTIKTTTEILAVLVAAVWVYETFIYNEWIKPSIQPPHVELKSTAAIAGEKSDFYAVDLKSTLTNSSKVKVHILSYWLDVYAYSIKPTTDKTAFTRNITHDLNENKQKRRSVYARDYEQASKPVIIQIQQLFDHDWWLESGEDLSVERTVFIPKQFDVAQINFYARTAKDEDNICIHWGKNDINSDRPGEIAPQTYLKTGGNKLCNQEKGYERFNKNNKHHRMLRDKYGLSTTSYRIEIPLIRSKHILP